VVKTPERFEHMKRYVYEHLANSSFKPHVDRTFHSNKMHIGILIAISSRQDRDHTLKGEAAELRCIDAGFFEEFARSAQS